jgi:glycosidase
MKRNGNLLLLRKAIVGMCLLMPLADSLCGAASRGGPADKGIRGSDVYLGWIPVQVISAGEPLDLDMRRFGNWPEGVQVRWEGDDKVEATYDAKSRLLRLALVDGVDGIVHGRVILLNDATEIGRGELTLAVRHRVKHEFRYEERGQKSSQRVLVVGSFNGWNQAAHPLVRGEDGIWRCTVWLEPGEYVYKFVVDGDYVPDPDNPLQTSDSFANSVLRIAGVKKSKEIQLFAHSRENAEAVLRVVPGDAALRNLVAVAQHSNGSTTLLETKRRGDEVRVNLKGVPLESWIRVIADDEAGGVSNVVRFTAGETNRFHWQDGIIYYAFTDRFYNGNKENDYVVEHPDLLPPANFFNGDLEGITLKIREGYFNNLGVNVLWLAPLNENPRGAFQSFKAPHRWYTGYHGYWPVSEKRVEPRIGGEAALKELVTAAHERGMKVIADLVLKHVHEEHPWWKEHRDWFGTLELPDGRRNLRLWDEHSFTTWFEPFLPAFDFENPEPVRALINNSVWWLEEYELDGFRLDAVKHIQHSFWWKFRTALRERVESKRKELLYFVGETFMDRRGIMSFVGPNMLDGQFDFPLYDTIMDVFAMEKSGFPALESSLKASEMIYGKETLMSTLLGNHDKSRFMAFADGDLPDPVESDEEEVGWKNPPRMDHFDRYYRLMLGMTFLLTIDGVPMIYYGDEIGMTGAGDPDNRRMMRFGDELTNEEKVVKDHWSRLAKIRRDHPALRYGHRRVTHLDENVYGYVRAYFQDRVAVVINRGEDSVMLQMHVAPEFTDGEYLDQLSGERIKVVGGKMIVEIPGRTSRVICKLLGI